MDVSIIFGAEYFSNDYRIYVHYKQDCDTMKIDFWQERCPVVYFFFDAMLFKSYNPMVFCI